MVRIAISVAAFEAIARRTLRPLAPSITNRNPHSLPGGTMTRRKQPP